MCARLCVSRVSLSKCFPEKPLRISRTQMPSQALQHRIRRNRERDSREECLECKQATHAKRNHTSFSLHQRPWDDGLSWKKMPQRAVQFVLLVYPFHPHTSLQKRKKIPWEAPGMQMHAGKCVDLHPFIAANTLCAKCCRDMVKMLKLRRRALVTSPTHKLYTHKRQL